MKRIVCVGGGTGLAQILKGFARSRARVTGVVGVTDNGGHTGFLRKALEIPAVGDLRSCMTALAGPGFLGGMLGHRFRGGALDGVSLGNLMLAKLCVSEGSLSAASRALAKELDLASDVLPVSDDDAQVCAELEGGRVAVGEWDIILRRPRHRVRRVFHRPRLRVLPEVAARVREADLVVFAPGSLITGIVSAALADGFREALGRSDARVVQVVNLMTQPGQTDGMDARAHVEAFEALTRIRPDSVVVNTGRPDAWLLRRYAEHEACIVADDFGADSGRATRADLVERPDAEELARYARAGAGRWNARPHFIRHDGNKLVRALLRLA